MENIKLTFELYSYLNLKSQIIEFADQTHIINFAKETILPKKTNKSEDIFEDTVTLDTKEILEEEIKKENNTIIHNMKKMVLYQSTSLSYFLKIVNSICKCEISNLSLKFCENLNFIDKLGNIANYSEYGVVGNNSIHLYTDKPYRNNFGDQFAVIYPWYNKMTTFIYDLVESAKKKPELTLNYQITTLHITYYCNKKGISINLPELFNLQSTGKLFKRIIVHDQLIDLYTNTDLIQYIKQNKNLNVSTKHVGAKSNTVSLVCSLNITSEIILESMDIFKDGSFTLLLQITNNIPLNIILETIDKFMKTTQDGLSNFNYLFNRMFIQEVNNSYDMLEPTDYIKKISRIEMMYNIPSNSIKDVKQLTKMFIFDKIITRFYSLTSVNLCQFSFISEGSLFNFTKELMVTGNINDTNYKAKLSPEAHFSLDSSNNLILTMKRFTSLEEMIFSLLFTLPLVQYQNLTFEENDTDFVKNILKQSRKIPTKTNLKQLTTKDPVLFGPRKVDKNPRSYSALAQKAEQRPVLLSEFTYNKLKDLIPERVVALQNQTYQDQLIYFLCPFDEFSYINYHHFHGQKCIVRCTSKLNNKTQYDYCASELGAELTSEFTNKFTNNAIVTYNEFIKEGRRTYLPNEFKNIFSDYIMYVPVLNKESIKRYCNRLYNLEPYILRRNSSSKQYIILSDLLENEDYMLIIQSEQDENKYFVFINFYNNKPLKLNEHTKLKEFLKEFIKLNPLYSNFLEYICNYILLDYSENNKKLSNEINKVNQLKTLELNKFVKELYKNWGCKFVYKKDKLYGIIKRKNGEDYYYSIPSITFLNIDDTFIKYSRLIKDLDSNLIKYPTFESIYGNPNNEENNYIPNDSQIEIIIKPSREDIKYINGVRIHDKYQDIVIVTQSHLLTDNTLRYSYKNDYLIQDLNDYYKLYYKDKITNIKVHSITSKDDNMKDFLNIYIEKYSKFNPNFVNLTPKENEDNFIKFLESRKVFSDETTFNFIGKNTLSFIRSKIKKEDLKEYLKVNSLGISLDEIKRNIYNKLLKILKLSCDNNEIILKKAFV